VEKTAGRRTERRQREGRAREASAVIRGQQKRFQATVRFSSFPDRHARSEHGRYVSPKPVPLLPAAAFGPLRINAPERFSVPHTRSLSFAATFRSPPRLPPFGCLHEGSPFPAYRFDSIPDHCSQPVRLVTPGLAARFEPPARGRSM
jgi:hypothetical protein